jgi:hypothetical protein
MRQVTDENEVKELLGKYQYEMFNGLNNYKGEITTLNEEDIENILYDMSLNVNLSAKMYLEDDGMVVVKYPHGECELKSRGLR